MAAGSQVVAGSSPAAAASGLRYSAQLTQMELRASVHDQRRLEFRISQVLPPGRREVEYQTDWYCFVPNHLVPISAFAEKLHARLRTYDRLEAPRVELPALAAGKGAGHVLAQLRRPVEDERLAQVSYDCRLYAATATSASRRTLDSLRAVASEALVDAQWQQLALELVEALAAVVAAFRAAAAVQSTLAPEPPLPEVLAVVGDFLEHEWQTLPGKIVAAADATGHDATAVCARFSALGGRSHPSQVILARCAPLAAERAWWRYGWDRKVVSSCLFLHSEDSHADFRAGEVIAAAAAALAMTFAVTVGAIAAWHWPMNSLPWMTIAILAYIGKDRMKEYLRRVGGARLRKALPRRVLRLIDPQDGEEVGQVREVVEIVDQLPADILAARARGYARHLVLLPEAERVVHLRRSMRLEPDHQRDGCPAVISIIRLDLDQVLQGLDNPQRAVVLLDPDDGSVQRRSVARVYHMPVVIRFGSTDGEQPRLLALRVILARDGIRRIEPLDQAAIAEIAALDPSDAASDDWA